MGTESQQNFHALYHDVDNAELKHLEQTLKQRTTPLRFVEPYETNFKFHYATKFSHRIRTAIFIGLALFLVSYLFDFLFMPDEPADFLIRFVFLCPILAIISALIFSTHYIKRQQEIILLSALVLSVGALDIAYDLPEILRNIFINGTMLIMIYALCFTRMLFWNAVKFTIFNFIAINILLMFETDINLTELLSQNYLFLTGCSLLLTNNFFMEHAERQEYLQGLIMQIENKKLEAVNNYLNQLANKDGLTGLANFRHFDTMLKTEWSRGYRYRYPITLLIFDVDYFKALNDTYGHQYGDDCLQSVANILRKYARRPGDLAARYGGDEFVIMLIDTDTTHAARIAEEILHATLELRVTNQHSKVMPYVTLTVGIATLLPENQLTTDVLFKQADDALYSAKQKGRNCVATYTDLPAQKKLA